MGEFISKEEKQKNDVLFFLSKINFFRTTPVAPPFPDQWQMATENHHHPPQAPERPISATSSDRHSNVDNLHDIVASINQKSLEKILRYFHKVQC
jgi:hypothetical protein